MITKRAGQAIIALLMICLIMGILAGAVFTFQSGQRHLLSRTATDYLALSVAEAGLHAVMAEMNADYQFVTHGNPYIPRDDWGAPATRRYFHIANTDILTIDSNNRGTYTGTLNLPVMRKRGQFKVRMRLLRAFNSTETTTVSESHRYFLLEAAGRVGDSHRIISTVIEKTVPGNYLLYDGQILDTGAFGPYSGTFGQFDSSRIYGHEMISFSQRGSIDRGVRLTNTEKIYTPGHIFAHTNTNIEFSDNNRITLTSSNDSSNPDNFVNYKRKSDRRVIDYYIQDGEHGARSHKFPQLNPEYWRSATRPAPIILRPGSNYGNFKQSKWRNPAKPNETVYDLFFGWEYRNLDKKVLLYSEVPLRIWGCPPYKGLTIFSEKDVYIAGDFNANPDNPQNYDSSYMDYTRDVRNGTDKNGVQVLSMGRIWFDYSNPMQFLRNEFRTLIDYEIAMALGGEELNTVALGGIVFPPRMNTGAADRRAPMTFMHFPVLSALFSLPKEPPEIIPVTVAGIGMHPQLENLRNYLRPSENPAEYSERFSISSRTARARIYANIGNRAYTTGTLTRRARDSIIDTILDQAEKDIQEGNSGRNMGPWNAADRLYRLARKYPGTGFRMPEMTVNAMLIDSSELNARWSVKNSRNKVRNELGNIESSFMRSYRFMNPNSRLILRHHGSMIHLRNRPESVFLNGSAREDSPLVRRQTFDRTFVRTGGDYFPPYPMAGFSILTWEDKSLEPEKFANF